MKYINIICMSAGTGITLYLLGGYLFFLGTAWLLAKAIFYKSETRTRCDHCKQPHFINKSEPEFDEWFSILIDELKHAGFHAQVDHDTARNDYDLGMAPERSAELFIKTMKDELN